MPSLKALRVRINSVKSTQKITSAMKMVAASKLRRAQMQAEAARPYAERMERMLSALAASVVGSPTAPPLLAGTGNEKTHLLVAVTADRGLAGAFNTNVGRATRNLARKLEAEGKTVKILAVGRKGRDYIKRELSDRLVGDISYAGRKRIEFVDAEDIGKRVTTMLASGEYDAGAGAAAGRHGGRAGWRAGDIRIRAGRGGNPRQATAAGAGRADVSRAAGKCRR
jgi:F-type H+-transporting ATPase subunit gamma